MSNLHEILSDRDFKSRVEAVGFGADDYLTDFDVRRTDGDNELDFIRKYFAMQAHGQGYVSVDTPFVNLKDPEGL